MAQIQATSSSAVSSHANGAVDSIYDHHPDPLSANVHGHLPLQHTPSSAASSSGSTAPPLTGTYTIGTRRSQLALLQTTLVQRSLSIAHPQLSLPIVEHTTIGDRNQSTPLHLLTPYSQQQPAKSLWTDELEGMLLRGALDMLVHSLKDVPTTLKPGCEIGAIAAREDPRDALVVRAGRGETALEDLAPGSVVGTGSVRRVAQLKRLFPHLRFEDMRGNLNTRLGKLDADGAPFAALILATAGLRRLGMAGRITAPVGAPTLYHAVGQGALGLEVRTGDEQVREVLRGVGHWETEWRCGAERGCLRVLEGGCSVPVGVESELVVLDSEPASSTSSDADEAGPARRWLSGQTFIPLSPSSPTLHFSGLLPPSRPFPTASAPQLDPAELVRRRALLTLHVCVTSLDGSSQVVCAPEAVEVRSYQEAERWGEMCAARAKEEGAQAILEEVGRVRREREEADMREAVAESKGDVQAVDGARDGA